MQQNKLRKIDIIDPYTPAQAIHDVLRVVGVYLRPSVIQPPIHSTIEIQLSSLYYLILEPPAELLTLIQIGVQQMEAAKLIRAIVDLALFWCALKQRER